MGSFLPWLNLLTVSSSHIYSCFLYCAFWDFACRNSFQGSNHYSPNCSKPLPVLGGTLFTCNYSVFSLGLGVSESANVFVTVLGLYEDGLLVGIFWEHVSVTFVSFEPKSNNRRFISSPSVRFFLSFLYQSLLSGTAVLMQRLPISMFSLNFFH